MGAGGEDTGGREEDQVVHPLVVHCQKAPYDVYVGRYPRDPTGVGRFGNPFEIGRDGTREEVVARYREWVQTQPDLMAALPSLRGRILGCWCLASPCHAEVLAELDNAALP